MAGEDWLVRQEERIQVGKEMKETGRIRLHKYVDTEPVEQAIHVYHEEYDVERVPIAADERIGGTISEGEQEIILHEERAVLRKEVVPVERVRLRAKRIDEDTTVRDQLRRERIEIEPDQSFVPGAAQETPARVTAKQVSQLSTVAAKHGEGPQGSLGAFRACWKLLLAG